jgi:hypothetical protein
MCWMCTPRARVQGPCWCGACSAPPWGQVALVAGEGREKGKEQRARSTVCKSWVPPAQEQELLIAVLPRPIYKHAPSPPRARRSWPCPVLLPISINRLLNLQKSHHRRLQLDHLLSKLDLFPSSYHPSTPFEMAPTTASKPASKKSGHASYQVSRVASPLRFFLALDSSSDIFTLGYDQ